MDQGFRSCFTPFMDRMQQNVLSCKAIAGSNRADVLTESAPPLSFQELALKASTHNSEEKGAHIDQMQKFYTKPTSEQGEYNMEVIKLLRKIKQILDQTKAALCENSRTARLWIQYTECVKHAEILRSARTSDLTLHLHSEKIMIKLSKTS